MLADVGDAILGHANSVPAHMAQSSIPDVEITPLSKEEHDLIKTKDKETHDTIVDALRECPLFEHMPDEAIEKMVDATARAWVVMSRSFTLVSDLTKETSKRSKLDLNLSSLRRPHQCQPRSGRSSTLTT